MKYTKYLTCYNPAKTYGEFCFYILNKGKNSGKPLREPCANCYVFHARNYEMYEYFYWLLYAMWQGQLFSPLLKGSCIEFITIDECNKLIVDTYTRSRMHTTEYTKVCGSLIKVQKARLDIVAHLVHTEKLKKELLRGLLA